MKIKLAENIRSFRKEWRMTQEQLVEALGSRWGLSTSGRRTCPPPI